jgi:hypothetical protein
MLAARSHLTGKSFIPSNARRVVFLDSTVSAPLAVLHGAVHWQISENFLRTGKNIGIFLNLVGQFCSQLPADCLRSLVPQIRNFRLIAYSGSSLGNHREQIAC